MLISVLTHAATVPARSGGRGKTIVGICKSVAETYETLDVTGSDNQFQEVL
jgi:hypothetical protein